MSATLWMKSTCTTCREARAALAAAGLAVQVRDYARIALTRAELEGLLPEDPTPFMGTRSPAYKALGLAGRRLSKEEAITLILQDANLLKRPILVHAGGVVVGFQREAYARLETESA